MTFKLARNPTSSWYHRAVGVITAAIAEGGTVKEVRKRIDAAYPFGLRQDWPYKAWLRARRDLLHQHGLMTPAERQRFEAKQAEEEREAQRQGDGSPVLVQNAERGQQQTIEGVADA